MQIYYYIIIIIVWLGALLFRLLITVVDVVFVCIFHIYTGCLKPGTPCRPRGKSVATGIFINGYRHGAVMGNFFVQTSSVGVIVINRSVQLSQDLLSFIEINKTDILIRDKTFEKTNILR